jgi:hypothetical protein
VLSSLVTMRAAIAGVTLGLSACTLVGSLDELRGGGDPTAQPDGGGGASGATGGGGTGAGFWPCLPGRSDCDGNPQNGCEVELASHPLHCGKCGEVCPARPSAGPACVDGQCDIVCDIFTANCDDDRANGCETPIQFDDDNCGGCGKVCGTANAARSECSKGVCVLECEAGFASCDGDDANGCEQELTVPDNCGACGRDCLGGDCVDGACTPVLLAEGLISPSAFRVVGSDAYVATNQYICGDLDCLSGSWRRQLKRAPLEPGALEIVVATPNQVRQIEADAAGTLYWIEPTRLVRFELGSTAPVVVGSGIDPTALQLDATNAYLVSNSRLYSIPLDSTGGTPILLASPNARDYVLVLAANALYFWSDAIGKLPLDGSPPESLGLLKQNYRWLAADDRNLYYAIDNSLSAVSSIPLSGGTPVELVPAERRPQALVTDGAHVYYWLRDTGELKRVPVGGGATSLIVRQPTGDALIQVLDELVVWLHRSQGKLYKIAK